MIAIEITAAVDAVGTIQTLYLADDRLVTGPGDTPAHTFFDDRLLDPGALGRSVYSDGRTGGASKLEIGEIVVANIDGALDGWLDYGIDGRAVVIRQGEAGTAYPSAWTTLLTATADGLEADMEKIIVRLRDKAWVLDRPLLTATYGGTNALPAGLDGVEGDLKGKLRPRSYGVVDNVSPTFVNTSRLIYEVGPCNSVDAVYDKCAALTKGTDYTSQVDMETNAPAAGNFRAWPAGGYIRLGSGAAGQVTADVTQGAAPANRTVAQILKQIALDAGLTIGEISATDVTALDTANNAVVGIWVTDADTALAVMDRVAASIGAWFGFDAAGLLRMGRLEAPCTPIDTFYDYDIGDKIERRPPRDNGRPVWRTTLGYARNWTPQTSDLAGAVTQDRRAWLKESVRTVASSNAAVLTQHLLASELRVDGLLISSAAAATEVTRIQALHGQRRDILDVPLPADRAAGIGMMDTVSLVLDRFGMGGAGKALRVIGLRYEMDQRQVILTLWG